MMLSVAGALVAETGVAAESDFSVESANFWDIVDVVSLGGGISAAVPFGSSTPSADADLR